MVTTVDSLLEEAVRYDEELKRLVALRRMPDGSYLRLKPTDPLWLMMDAARTGRDSALKRAQELEEFINERTTR